MGAGIVGVVASVVSACIAGATLAVAAAPAALAVARGPVDPLHCIVADPNPSGIAFGPTDIAATTGNGGLSVALNAAGTVTVARWPNPSYSDHVKHLTTGTEQPLLGARPNEGILAGIAWPGGFTWLRDADRITQRYVSDRSDTAETTYELERPGLTVTVSDTVDPDRGALVRNLHVGAKPGSTVTGVDLVAFANLQMTGRHLPLLPIWDTCLDQLHSDAARWDPGSDAVVAWTTDGDPAAAALGWDSTAAAHDVAPDRDAIPFARQLNLGAPDAYEFATAAGGRLAGREAATGQTDAAVSTRVDLGDGGSGYANLVLAFGQSPAEATATLAEARSGAADVAARKQRYWEDWLGTARLPHTGDAAITAHALRALIVLRQAIDPASGAIVASISSQPPYSVDWMRDGAFLNEALYAAGHPEIVAAHNRFYARSIARPGHSPPGRLLTPDGNWPMNVYPDGAAGGPIPFEIDETGLGLWTLARHFEVTGDRAYLDDVWPAVTAAAEFLTRWRDPLTGLPLPAWEDDVPVIPRRATLQSSSVVELGLRTAAGAAEARGDESLAQRWRARAGEIAVAIETYYASPRDPVAYGGGGGAAFLLYPTKFADPTSARARATADVLWDETTPSFAAPGSGRTRGAYEAKNLLAMATVWAAAEPSRLEDVRHGLQWLANVDVVAGTGITGEAWEVSDGAVRTTTAQPHVWGMNLFYLASLVAYPDSG